ncbi:MAG: zinc-binding alcohol dehydrogenase family protein [Sphingomonadales bacterium]|nr:zinc-binding alcohol dehydrogenase family protein [Sphingomonadales bacterium]
MKAAVVTDAGAIPAYADFAEPVAGPDERIVTVSAAALSPLARVRASGKHYSSANVYPFVAGVDGIGRLDDGQKVYFFMPRGVFGAMAERTVVPTSRVIAVPEGLDDAAGAAIANPGMSSWAALTQRARLQRGETVLINGATGSSGQLAVRIARHLGAAKIIATGRNVAVLDRLGADVTIPLTDDFDALEARFKLEFAAGIDVVIDYLWGPSAEHILAAAAKMARDATPVRFVQIGTMSGLDITLPGALLRSKAIELMGSGLGSVALDSLVKAVGALLGAVDDGGLSLPYEAVPLVDVATAWSRGEGDRIVFTV